MTAYGQSFLIDRSYYNWPSARFWSEMVQCFGGYSSFFHISNFFSFEPPIKKLVVLIKLVNCRSFNDPVLLVIMSSHSMICCWTMSHHGIFISQSFDSNLSRDRICTTSMALNLEFYGFFLILIDVATRKILATNKKLWFLPVVWWSLRFFNKCRKPIIKCWSIPVPVHKTGNVLKRFKDNMTHW